MPDRLSHLITLLISLHLITTPTPVTDHEAAWLAVGDRGVQLWEMGKALGLVAAWERSMAFTLPMRGGSGLISDYRCDLSKLRDRAMPVVRACPVP
jgi:hypothetical protein